MADTFCRDCKPNTLLRMARKMDIRPPVGEELDKAEILREVRREIHLKGAKLIANVLPRETLQRICEMENVQHNDNNPKNRMVLSKRVYEILGKGVRQWVFSCKDKELILEFCTALNLDHDKKTFHDIQTMVADEIVAGGAASLLNTFDVSILQKIVLDMGLKGSHSVNKSSLITAITTHSDIQREKRKSRPTVKTLGSKKPIEKCTTTEQLYTFYTLEELRVWARDHSIEGASTLRKALLIKRILAWSPDDHEEEDQENSVTSSSSNRRPRSAPPQKRAKTTTEDEDPQQDQEDEGTVELHSDEEEEEEEEEEEDQDEEEEEIAEDQEEEEIVEEEEEEQEDRPEDLRGFSIVMTGSLSRRRASIARDLRAVGAICTNNISDATNLLLSESLDVDSAKMEEARQKGIRIVTEDFVRHFYTDDE